MITPQTTFSLSSQLWKHSFPIIYEGDTPTAVIMDIASFRQFELILENWLQRGEEPEDEIILHALQLWQMINKQYPANVSEVWVTTLYEL